MPTEVREGERKREKMKVKERNRKPNVDVNVNAFCDELRIQSEVGQAAAHCGTPPGRPCNVAYVATNHVRCRTAFGVSARL